MDEALEERISSRWQPMVRLEEMVTPRTHIEVTLIAPWRMGAGCNTRTDYVSGLSVLRISLIAKIYTAPP